jgi:hypothetical protein
VEDYNKLTSVARKRKAGSSSESSCKQLKQPLVTTTILNSNANLVTQATVDRLIMNSVVEGLLPLHLVQHEAFVALVNGLQPNRSVLSRPTLTRRINDKAKDVKQKLIDLLKEQSYLATTADCWSSHGKSYIGVTGHWIDAHTLERKSACLALRRLKGSHTYDVIASTLEGINTEFGVRRKTIRTTTDSGSNFVKAFSVFGQQANESDGDETEDDAHDEESNNDLSYLSDQTVHVDLSSILNADVPDYELPRHQRCAAHMLNLVSTTDACKAEADATYKKISRSAFGKCQALWNKYGRSNHAVDTVTDRLQLGLKRPNQTRWNSVFLAVERLIQIIEAQGEDDFHSVCAEIGVTRLTAADLSFLREYLSVMKPVAQALNIMQSEKHMFLGCLIPTIMILREKLIAKSAAVTMCKPLVSALIEGIDNR